MAEVFVLTRQSHAVIGGVDVINGTIAGTFTTEQKAVDYRDLQLLDGEGAFWQIERFELDPVL